MEDVSIETLSAAIEILGTSNIANEIAARISALVKNRQSVGERHTAPPGERVVAAKKEPSGEK
jgi:hypothetical protein